MANGLRAAGHVRLRHGRRTYPVKDPLNLVDAFLHLREIAPQAAAGMRLAMAGGGPLLENVKARLAASGAASQAWISGDIDSIPEFLCGLDLFVLPSLGEGISNAILEAMATGFRSLPQTLAATPSW